jgi:hypothetical protein
MVPSGDRRPKLTRGEWPEKPSLRFLVHWALRRDELCDPSFCPDAPDDGGRCGQCPLDKLDAAQSSEAGLVLRRALDLRAALKLGLRISFDEIGADEFAAMPVLEEEHSRAPLDRQTQKRTAERTKKVDQPPNSFFSALGVNFLLCP